MYKRQFLITGFFEEFLLRGYSQWVLTKGDVYKRQLQDDNSQSDLPDYSNQLILFGL